MPLHDVAPGGLIAKLFDQTLGADTATLDTGANAIAGEFRHNAGRCSQWCIHAGERRHGRELRPIRARCEYAPRFSGEALTDDPSQSGSYGQTSFAMNCLGDSADANRFSVVTFDLFDYSSLLSFKQGFEFYGGIGTASNSNVRTTQSQFVWKSTAAINQIAFTPTSGNFKVGSSLTIYGLP